MDAESLGGATLAAGTRLGRYEIVEAVAAGGMGEVYRARDTHLPRSVAIKTLRLVAQGSDERRRRLQREARIAARLSHPHICRLYDLGREGEIDFLVMEYLEGETLRQRLERGPLDLDQAIRLGLQIAGALAEAHGHGVIHRDLKPSNIMLTGDGVAQNVSLLDFGIATHQEAGLSSAVETLTDDPLTREGQIVGTTPYMSPEQLLGQEVDARTDVFTFGVVFYEMVSGRHPFGAPSRAAVMARILEHERPVLTLTPGAPSPELVRFVAGCLAKQPARRWQTAAQLSMELEGCRGRAVEAGDAYAASSRADDASHVPLTAAEEAEHGEPAASTPAALNVRTAATRTALVLGGVVAAAAALYLNNPSVHDAVLYEILALLGAVPITFLAAALGGVDGATAARRIFRGLGSLGGAAPPDSHPSGRWVVGVALFLFLGAIGTFVLGHVADNAMPYLTFLPHAERESAEWAFTNPNDDWAVYRAQYKAAFLAHTGGDEADYQAQKHRLGRGSIRATRTLWMFAVIVAAAGAIDLARRRRVRGWTGLLIGLGAVLVIYAFWYAREGHYVKEMVVSSLGLPDPLRPALPASAPEALRRLIEVRQP